MPLEVIILHAQLTPGHPGSTNQPGWFPFLSLPPVPMGLVLGAGFFLNVEIWLWEGALLTCPSLLAGWWTS